MRHPTEQTLAFRDRVERALLERARYDPREDVLEGVAEIYRQEAAIYGRADPTVAKGELEAVVDETLQEALEVQAGEHE